MNTQLMLVGGFLGAGKTTLLGHLGRTLTERGLRVGLITNDQAPDLVDTAQLQGKAVGVREVAGSCFCCNFPALSDAIAALRDGEDADLLVAEPVGSCTDLSATILQPVKEGHAGHLDLRPMTVLADPIRLLELLTGTEGQMHPGTKYIYQLQLAEADIIALTKSDAIAPGVFEQAEQVLQHIAPHARVVRISALTGEGVDDWLNLVLGDDAVAPGQQVLEVDYDLYAEGEAVLGWVNATATLEPVNHTHHDWPEMVTHFIGQLQRVIAEQGFPVGHVKLILAAPSSTITANFTDHEREPTITESVPTEPQPQDDVSLTVNARVQTDPETLRLMVSHAIEALRSESLDVATQTLRSLSPGRPVPTHRYADPV